MFDPSRYDDDVVLSTAEVAAWTGWKPSTVLSIPNLNHLAHLKRRHRCFRAGDVKAAILGDGRNRAAPAKARHLERVG